MHVFVCTGLETLENIHTRIDVMYVCMYAHLHVHVSHTHPHTKQEHLKS